MNRLFVIAAACAAVLVAPGVAQGGFWENDGHFYVGAQGGTQDSMRNDLNYSGTTTADRRFYEFGWHIAGHAGYHWEGGPRAEVEFNYADNDSDKLVSTGAAGWIPANGEQSHLDLMFNVFYDFDLENHDITPFVGGGLGVSWVDAREANNAVAFNEDDTAFAYQLMAGLLYPLNDEWDLYIEYRHFGTSELTFVTPAGTPNVVVPHLRDNGISFGANWHLTDL